MQDAAGQPLNQWTKLGEAWASIRSLGGSEFVGGSGEKAQLTHEIVTAYQPSLGLMAEDRIRYGQRRFGIESVQNRDERGAEWVIFCTEMTSTSAQL